MLTVGLITTSDQTGQHTMTVCFSMWHCTDEEDELDEEGNLIFGTLAFEDLPEREQKMLVLQDLLNDLSIEA